jgi:putative ABC transport system substrate-binding protein
MTLQRRDFITLGGAAVAWPLAARGQAGKVLRIGTASPNPRIFPTWGTFEQRMRELGYFEGQNLAIDFVHLAGPDNRVDQVMQDIVRRKPDVIIAFDENVLKAAMSATKTIPIVVIAVTYDPMEIGAVTSLARPTGNVTGTYLRRPELVGKQMEIFAKTFPGRTRLSVLYDSLSADLFNAAAGAAPILRLELRPLKLDNPPYDFAGAFRNLAESDVDFLYVLSTVFFNESRSALAQLAISHRLPTMFVSNLYVEAGGLMSYGPNTLGMFRRAAEYVDRIAKGAKPSDLPIEQPSKFDLAINLRTAKSLGVTFPPEVQAIADQVIE